MTGLAVNRFISAEPQISDHALIGDGRTAALISSSGAIGWLCLPDFSSPSLFGGILDRHAGGEFIVRPRAVFDVRRRYVEETPVLETTFETAQGVVRVTDLFSVLDSIETLEPMREILRTLDAISGDTELELKIEPRPNYGRIAPRIKNHGELGWCCSWSNELLIVRSNVDWEQVGDGLYALLRMHAGERVYLSLSYVKGDIAVLPQLGAAADERLNGTVQWWQDWIKHCTYEGNYKDAVRRSAVVLKLLSFSLSGAIVAAPTTSLPESIGGERNWDYRYCWLRDAGLTMQAFIGLGFHKEGGSFLSWLLHATRLTWPELQVVYDVYGRTWLKEEELDHFAGYRGSRPVRIGNGAYSQYQLDVYGEAVFAADAYVGGGGTLEPTECRMLIGFGKVVCKQWREADHGIWEVRGARRQNTFSKMMCWVALDRLLKLDALGALSLGRLRKAFEQERHAIAVIIEERAYSVRLESYVSELDGDKLDASLLLMPCLGYKSADEPRLISTYERIWQRLGHNGLLDRYERESDSLGGGEGTFGICSFWAVHHLACRGDVNEAKRLFEHILSFANDVGLFGEEIDAKTGAALGNFPQAFTHVGLINAALAIERAGTR